jgi:hypothetical protein
MSSKARQPKSRERNNLLKKYYGLKNTTPTIVEEPTRPFDLGKYKKVL